MRRLWNPVLGLLLLSVLLCGCDAREQLKTTAPVQEIYPTSVETEKLYYSDGTPASDWKYIYDLEENLVGTNWIEYFEDGSISRSGLQRSDRGGNLLEFQENVFFSDGRLQMRSFRKHDAACDRMTVTEEHYLESGIPEILVDGIYNSDCSILLEGREAYFYPDGTLSYSHTVTAEKSLEVSYLENGEISHSEETLYTYDAMGNLIQSVTSGYDRSAALTYTQQTLWAYDDAGRKLSERLVYEENGVRILQQKDTWAYNAAGSVAEQTSISYIRGELQCSERIIYTYDTSGLCVTERRETTAGAETYVVEYTYVYDEAGSLIEKKEIP